MRNQSTGGNKKASPSSVDKAGGKRGMPKPKRTTKQAPAPAPKAQAPRKAAPSAPKAQTPKKPAPTPSASTPEYNPFAGRGQVPTPSADIASNRTYTPAQKAAMNNDKRYSKQGTVSSNYMDMLNQMRSQSSSAQGMGPLSSTSL